MEIKQNVKHIYTKKDKHERKDYRFNVNINAEDYALLKEKCENEGINISSFVRSQIKNFITGKIKVIKRDGFYTLDEESEESDQ